MKRSRFILSFISVLFLLSCSLFTFDQPLAVYTDPDVPGQTEAPTEEGVIPGAPTDEPVQPAEAPLVENNYGQIARAHLEELTAIGARVSGSENEKLAAVYITQTLAKLGYMPETEIFSARDENDETFSSQNIIAVKQGDLPTEIIIGAHYDSGDESLGADDNASGVGVMLETAELIANMQIPHTVRFIAFGSEENNLDGSTYYAERMQGSDVANTLAMVNLDSLAAGDFTYIYSDEGKNAFLRDWVLEWAGKNYIPLQTIRNVDLTDDGDYVADYGAFKDRGIPYIYFEATNWTVGTMDGWTQVETQYGDGGYIWHTPFDNLEYLDATFPGRVNEHLRIFVLALLAITTEFK